MQNAVIDQSESSVPEPNVIHFKTMCLRLWDFTEEQIKRFANIVGSLVKNPCSYKKNWEE